MTTYYTKDQLLKLFDAWQCKEPLPTRKTKVVIAFPPSPQVQFNLITAEKSTLKSTYGKTLYSVTFEHK